jgi:enterochelin esterase family protein
MIQRPRTWFFRAASLALLANLAWAQPAIRSPEVLPDGRVTFRLLAPKALAVAVKGLRHLQPQLMTKDAEGVWSVTVGPLTPDLYSYTFDVDGATFTDPINRRVKEWLSNESLVEVPGKPPLLISQQAVPHGILHRYILPSGLRHGPVPVVVYTPPGFDVRAPKIYPVVFLLHGYGDEENAWVDAGRANFIADNLIAQGRMVPAIIIMTNGHPEPLPPDPRIPDYGAQNEVTMVNELMLFILPFVQANFPVTREADGRAIAGLSMGGGQALSLGLMRPDVFGWVGGFSSSVPKGDWPNLFRTLLGLANPDPNVRFAGEPKLPRLIWIGVGKDDSLLERNQKFHAWLESRHVPHEWHVTDGGHEWPVWRGYLAEFLERIFR